MGFRQKCSLVAVCALAIVGLVIASAPPDVAHGWTTTTGSVSAFLGSGMVTPNAVEVDANGNIYTSGTINNAATDFDPSPLTTYTLTPASANFTGYVAKLNSEGELQWAGLFTGSGTSRVNDIAVDSAGNVLAMGYFRGTIDLDPGSGTSTVQSSSSGFMDNFFAVRLSTSGALSWSHTLPVQSYGYSVDVDSSDNFVVIGDYAGINVDFDPGAGTAPYSSTSSGSTNIFVWSVTSAGTHRWVKQATGTGTVGKAVGTDSAGNVYICGTYQGSTTDFDPGPGLAQVASAGSQDFYLWSLNQSGAYRWVTTFGGSSGETCDGLDVSSSGNVVVSGTFYTAIDLGRDLSNEVTAVSGQDYFFGVFDSTGANSFIYGSDSTGIWTRGMDGSSVWFAGRFTGTVDLNPDGAVTNNVTSRGGGDVYLVEFDLTGTFQRAFSFGGSSGTETPGAIAFSGGNIFIAGDFSSNPTNFNPGNGTAVNISATGSSSGFVNKLTSVGQVVVPPTTTTTTTTTTVSATTTTAPPTATTTTAPSATTTTAPLAGSDSSGGSGGSPVASVPPGATTLPGTATTVASVSTTVKNGSVATATSSPAGGATNGSSTTTTEPAPVSGDAGEDSAPDVQGVGPGQVGATVNGSPAVATVEESGGSLVVRVGGLKLRYTLTSPDGLRRTVSNASALQVFAGDALQVDFEGFGNDTTAQAWLVPGNTLIGSAMLTNGRGAVRGTVPSGASSGERRIVTRAETPMGEPVVVAYGVKVTDTGTGGAPWSRILLVVVSLAVVSGLLIPAARRRRQNES
ncbi:MAG: hypothetical protein ACO36A_07750 [Ilumatobacteraceae bacterium]